MTETTVDLDRMALLAAENRLLGVQARIEALLAHLAERRRWAGMTQDEVLATVKSEVFEVYLTAIGRKTS
jgi:hypothetical protein